MQGVTGVTPKAVPAPWLAPLSARRVMTEVAVSPSTREDQGVVPTGTGITGAVTPGVVEDQGEGHPGMHRHPGVGVVVGAAGSGTTLKKAAAAGIETGTAAASGRLWGVGRGGAVRRTAVAGGVGRVAAPWITQGVGSTTQGMEEVGRGSCHQEQQQEGLIGMALMALLLQGPMGSSSLLPW
jgi:hypothetical protein